MTLSEPSVDAVTVSYRTLLNGTAVDQDLKYNRTSPTGVVTFAPGETSKSIFLEIESDSLDERDENIVLQLFQPTNAVLAGAVTELHATGFILDDDGVGLNIALAGAPFMVREETLSGQIVEIPVELSRPSPSALTFNVTATAGTATAGLDYQLVESSVTFAPGQTASAVLVRIPMDNFNEPVETFRLDFSPISGAAFAGVIPTQTVSIISATGYTWFGGPASESFTGFAGPDALFGDAGNDTIFGGGGSDTLDGGVGADALDGGDDFDFASFLTATTGVTARLDFAGGNAGDALGDTYANIEGLIGSQFDDFLVGSDTVGDYLTAQGGDDYLAGRGGADVILGDAGSDTLDGGSGADVLDGGAGFDFASYLSATFGVVARLDLASLNTGDAAGDSYTSIEGLIGSSFNDYLVGTDTAGDYLTAQGGDDYLAGRGGADTILGDAGNDQFWGGEGADSLDGGTGYDIARYDFAASGVVARLDGGANAGEAAGDTFANIEALYGSGFGDVLVGDANANVLVGLDGGDLLYGLGGNDTLMGNGGIDAFAFNATGFGTDTVLDFSGAAAGANRDYVDFRGIGAFTRRGRPYRHQSRHRNPEGHHRQHAGGRGFPVLRVDDVCGRGGGIPASAASFECALRPSPKAKAKRSPGVWMVEG